MARKVAVLAVVTILAIGLASVGWAAEAATSMESSAGAAIGSTESAAAAQKPDTIAPGEATAKATIYCIGVMWPVEGDANGSATCAVSFREVGTDQWQEALPLYRKAPAVMPQRRRSGSNRPSGAQDRLIDSTRAAFSRGRSMESTGEAAMQMRPTGAQRPDFQDSGDARYMRDHYAANYLAGSIFNLKPGTTYEVMLRLTDSDGGTPVEKTLKAKTRTEPVVPTEGHKVEVTADGGAKALAAAFENAKAGDIIVVHKGTYAGPFKLSASGTAEKPIVIRGAGDGPAVLTGLGYEKTEEGESASICLSIDGSHVFVHGLAFADAVTAISIGGGRFTQKDRFEKLRASGGVLSNVVVTRCKTEKTQYGVVGTADDCFVADNEFKGLAADVEGIDWSEGEGVEIHGSGTVVCYNSMYHLADATSIYDFTDNQDFYNNDAYNNSDDGVEFDYGDANNRVWDNRFWFPANNGVSFQPYIGGPAYIIRNEVIGPKENSSKDRSGSRDAIFISNTFIGHKADRSIGRNCYLSSFDMPLHCVSRNNLYIIQDAELPAVDVHIEDVTNHTLNMDYDGLSGTFILKDRNGGKDADPALFPGAPYVEGDGLYVPIDSMRKAARTLDHYTVVDPAKIFEKPLPAMHEWRVETERPLMLLKGGCNAIDAGVAIPNVTDGYAGKAPDLGAHEFGKPTPHYGPRPQ